jgi:hypothetical protein
MIKKIIMALAFVFPMMSYAQNCNVSNISPKLIMNIKPLVIDQSKSVTYLTQISKDRGDHNPIGMYTADKSIRILPSFTLKANRFTSNSCAELNEVKIIVNVTPIIYLSTESQQYNCTKNRVYTHEMTHYKIEMDALNNLVPYLNTVASQSYNIVLNGSDDKVISQNIDQINKQVIDGAFDFIRKNTLPYHAQLDTVENYKKESGYCSSIENVYLSRLIRGGSVEVLK